MPRIAKGDCVNFILRQNACQYAVKFNDTLSMCEMERLVRETFGKCKRAFVCAHGRPTIYPLIIF